MNENEVKKMQAAVKRFYKLKDEIAVRRDELRNLIEDMRAIEDTCTDAVTELECAADTLSQYL